jgi:hypothetical protein
MPPLWGVGMSGSRLAAICYARVQFSNTNEYKKYVMENLKIIMFKELSYEFKQEWHIPSNHIFHVGWVTWVDVNYCGRDDEGGIILKSMMLHPEDNKYGINFPSNLFKVIDENEMEEEIEI